MSDHGNEWTAKQEWMDGVVDRILTPRTHHDVLDEQDDRDYEPDPPVYSDAEADRAADKWETDRDRTASQ